MIDARDLTLPGLGVLAIAAACASIGQDESPSADPGGEKVTFEWFEYRGQDEVFETPLAADEYRNPVVAGFFPDPSVVRKGDDFYMVHSSFAYLPGIPVLHSRNLVDWQLVGHVLARSGQLELQGLGVSRGIFAPTIRYHDGLFYVITTAVDAGGNFYVTAEDPRGPWSEPRWLPGVDGIDPDLFFDDDGRVFIAHNGPPAGAPRYQGHRAIWLREYELDAGKLVPSSARVIVDGGVDPAAEPIWIEAPHLYEIDGWYYLLCAEGGTGYDHSAVIFRTRNLDEPFVPWQENPILTQRDLDPGRPHPVTSAGHADLVQTADGRWWAVFLATRPYDGHYYNTGRETFLLPVEWRDGWPVILDAGEAIPYRVQRPDTGDASPGAEPLTGNFTWRDEFGDDELSLHWNLLRSLDRSWIDTGHGRLRVAARPFRLSSLEQPSYLGRRQQHIRFRASAELELPASRSVAAGLAAFQNATHHYLLAARRRGAGYEVFVERAKGGPAEMVARKSVHAGPGDALVLEIRGDGEEIGFYFRYADGVPVAVAKGLDGTVLSTAVASGFVGTTLGPHARLE